MTRYYKPVIVEDGGDIFMIYLGRPGRPRVYRRNGSTERRVEDEATLNRVTRALREGIDRRKATEAAEAARQRTWKVRALRLVGSTWGRLGAWWLAACLLLLLVIWGGRLWITS